MTNPIWIYSSKVIIGPSRNISHYEWSCWSKLNALSLSAHHACCWCLLLLPLVQPCLLLLQSSSIYLLIKENILFVFQSNFNKDLSTYATGNHCSWAQALPSIHNFTKKGTAVCLGLQEPISWTFYLRLSRQCILLLRKYKIESILSQKIYSRIALKKWLSDKKNIKLNASLVPSKPKATLNYAPHKSILRVYQNTYLQPLRNTSSYRVQE